MVYQERRNEVNQGIRELHDQAGGVGEPDSKTRLRLWPTAAKMVYTDLSVNKKQKIAAAVKRTAEEGNPPDIQRK